jgi:predicted CXXCH cytochrome family protein
MRNLLKSLIVVAVAVPALASAAVVGSKHDFSVGGGSTAFKATSETQVCKFCHAPHAAQSQKLIWAKATSAKTGWGTAQTTQSGTVLPTTIQASSRLCLSCHDGVLSVGAMGTSPAIAGTGLGAPVTGLLVVGFTGDHPVSVKYPAAGATTYFGSTSGAGTIVAEYKAAPAGVKLFADTTGGASGIECGSCHDVHNNAAAGNGFFLLAPQAGSAICLACHTK